MNDFHNVLKELRKKNKKSQTQLAEELNLTQRAYSHYETGTREPSIDTLIRIADYYKISLDTLMGHHVESE